MALYESTSYYDPETKQSRPRRKYLGIEDPETGKLIPSSGKRGRKKAQEGNMPAKKISREDKYKVKYEKLLKDFSEKEARIKQLEHENKKLKFSIAKLRDAASEILEGNVTS